MTLGRRISEAQSRRAQNLRGLATQCPWGLYAEQLARWLGHFPRERFLVLPAERFYADPDAVCGRVFDFLGLPPARLRSLSVPNRREYAPLDADLRVELGRRYAPHNRELADLLGEDFGWG